MTEPSEPKEPQVSFWQAVQNIAIHSLDRGQFLQVGVMAIIFLLIYKLESKEVPSVLQEFFRIFQSGWLFGWIGLV